MVLDGCTRRRAVSGYVMLKVLVVDDHVAVRARLAEVVAGAFEDVRIGQAGDGDTALRAIQPRAWDLVVLDINLPGLTGLETLALMREISPDLPIIMVSFHSALHYVKRSFSLGASAYVSKVTAADDLVEAIEAVLAGGMYLSRPLADDLCLSLSALEQARPDSR
jgi:DNA-binding NarL/FixJ family response regulator